MHDALYGPDGFYVGAGAPGGNFRTAAHAGAAWGRAIHALATRVDEQLGRPADFTVTDVGAGAGELLGRLASLAPERWRLIGVDLAARPADLHDRVEWRSTVPAETAGLLTAIELLDVVPVDVVELTADGPVYVEVDRFGDERLAGGLGGEDAAWLATWWPLLEVGNLAEIGSSRDALWQQITATLVSGAALMVDYAVDPRRDVAATLTGYHEGRQCAPVPDGSCDLTADVLVESLVAPGDLLMSQRDALTRLGLSTQRSAYAGDPIAHLIDLTAAGEVAELMDLSGLGGFTWLLHGQGVDPAALLEGQ